MGYVGEPIGLVKIQKCLYCEKKNKNVCHKIINSKVKPKIQYLNRKPSDKCDFNLLSLKNIFVSINHLPQRWSYLQPTCIRCQIYMKRNWTFLPELNFHQIRIDSLAPPIHFFKNCFPIHMNYRRVESSNRKAKKLHDHVTKNIVTTFILNSRRPTVQMRPNL